MNQRPTKKMKVSPNKNTRKASNSPKAAEAKASKASNEDSANESPPGKNITSGYVPVIPYPPTSEDTYDGIVFLIAHSEFKGKLCHLPTKKDMKQQTILISNIGNTCYWFIDSKKFDAFIKARFSDALSYSPLNIEHFTYVVKQRLKRIPAFAQKIEAVPGFKDFFDSRGIFSENPDEYCEREWSFFKQGVKMKYPEGRVMLLRRDKRGVPRFKILYKNEIKQGDFTLTKTQLYDKLYEDYNLRNVLLVDFGCTVLPGVDENNKQKLKNGRFGGKSIS
jgi:hypothetical protein